jgi:hypothetical protein
MRHRLGQSASPLKNSLASQIVPLNHNNLGKGKATKRTIVGDGKENVGTNL